LRLWKQINGAETQEANAWRAARPLFGTMSENIYPAFVDGPPRTR